MNAGPIIHGLRGDVPTTILCRGCADYMADDLIAKSQPDMVTPECFRCNPELDHAPAATAETVSAGSPIVLSLPIAITVQVPPVPRVSRVLRDFDTGISSIEYEEPA